MTGAVVATRFVRTRNGTMIHRAECQRLTHARYVAPWRWADTVSTSTVIDAAQQFGYAMCRYCDPFATHLEREFTT
jgi:hypothetical protein